MKILHGTQCGRTVKLKSINCMEIYYTVHYCHDIEYKTGLHKIKIRQLLI